MGKKSLTGLFLTLAAVAAWAQEGDPPSRVARLNLVQGQVAFRPGSVEDWAPATLNYPLTTGDHLWTEAGSKVELHVGSTAIRMDGQTALEVLNLNDQVVQLSVTGGTVEVHIRDLNAEESYEVDTPNVAISLLRPGDYRISADGDQNITYAVVRDGEAEVTGGGTAFPIRLGESARIMGTDTVSQEMGPAPPFDGFDQWAASRDQREASMVSARYVPRDMIGYEDLDQYGVWREEPQYGWVWTPRGIGAGWAPYHFGHWAWVEPWGWTWIDDAPWGFAPFHYGRWAAVGGAWFWVPGRLVVGVRPVYAPALVAFVGGVGMAAWFPLGPGEVYRPAYHVSEVYVRNVNIVHVSNVTVINNVNVRYMNQNVAGAVTVVPHDAFAGGRPVAGAAVAVRPGMMAQAQVVATAGVPPTREAVLGHAGPMAVHAPPSRFVEHTVVARNAPPPPPVSFAAKEQALRANGGRPLEPTAESRFRSAAQPVHPMVRTVGGGGPSGPGAGRPYGQSPEMNRPMHNDRPPGAQQPAGGGQVFGRPSQQTGGQQPSFQPHPQGTSNTQNTTPAAHTQQPQMQRPAVQPQGGRENERNGGHPAPNKTQPRKDNRKTEHQ